MRLDKDLIKQHAKGQWGQIINGITHLTPSIKHGPCPMCGGKDRFRFFNDFQETGGVICNHCGTFPDGFGLIGHVTGMDFHTVLTQTSTWLGFSNESDNLHFFDEIENNNKIEVNRNAIRQMNQIVNESKPISTLEDSDIVKTYLSKREVYRNFWVESLFTHQPSSSMVAIVTAPNGVPVAIHRTYLNKNGDKRQKDAKRFMKTPFQGAIQGGAVRLGEAQTTMGIAEGIETALAAARLFKMPVWACLTTSGMKNFIPPPEIEYLTIFADKDKSGAGEEAALKLAERLPEHIYLDDILIPDLDIPKDKKSIDWADVIPFWKDQNKHGFDFASRLTFQKGVSK